MFLILVVNLFFQCTHISIYASMHAIRVCVWVCVSVCVSLCVLPALTRTHYVGQMNGNCGTETSNWSATQWATQI